MNNRPKYSFFIFIGLCVVILIGYLSGCVYTPTTNRNNKTFDGSFLVAWYDDFIQLSINELVTRSMTLDEACSNLLQAHSENEKTEAIEHCINAYIATQMSLEGYLLFDDNHNRLSDRIGTYPIEESYVDSYVDNPESLRLDLESLTVSTYSVGLTAIEYLLFSEKKITSSENSQSYTKKSEVLKQLAHDVYLRSLDRMETINNGREAFISDNSSASTSSVSIVLNNLISNLEVSIRTNKIGFPLGIYGFGRHDLSPNSAQAIYIKNKYSVSFLKKALNSLVDFYYGNKANTDSEKNSFSMFLDKYLDDRPGYQKDKMVERLRNSIDKATVDVNALDGNISDMVQSEENKAQLESIYKDLQAIVVTLKSYTMQGLGLTITYNDGEEGD